MTKNKQSKNKFDPAADKMIRSISNGDNVKALQCLEQMLKDRLAKKIEEALK